MTEYKLQNTEPAQSTVSLR